MNPTFYTLIGLCTGYLLNALTNHFLVNKQHKPKKTVKEEAQLCALSLDKAIEHLEAGLKGPVTDKTPHKQTTGKLLREFRRTNRISQREVAKKSGISPSSLSRLECDYKKITKQQAKKLADVFNVPYKDLMKK